jgi:hypothetical protein
MRLGPEEADASWRQLGQRLTGRAQMAQSLSRADELCAEERSCCSGSSRVLGGGAERM